MQYKDGIRHLRLKGKEISVLKEKSEKAGLTEAEFIRRAITGKEVHEAPARDIPLLIVEIRKAGNALRELLKLAERNEDPKTDEIRKALEENRSAEMMVVDAFRH